MIQTAVGTVIAVIVVGALGELSVADDFLFIVIPASVVFLAVVMLRLGLRAREEVRALRAWQSEVSNTYTDLYLAVRRLSLREVITVAYQHAWSVAEDENLDLVFTSPDDHRVVVSEMARDPLDVASELLHTAPGSFPDDWEPLAERLDTLSRSGELFGSAVAEHLATLETRLTQRTARATLAMVAAEAEAKGWAVSWEPEHVHFERHGKTSNFADVRYDEELDLLKIRKALGLVAWGQPW